MEPELFMSSLSFLKVKPTENWYEFLLNPVSFLEHVQKDTCSPSVQTLISQFADRAVQEEREISLDEQSKIAAKEDIEIEDIQEQILHRTNKCLQLRLLSLAGAAQLKWNLVEIVNWYLCQIFFSVEGLGKRNIKVFAHNKLLVESSEGWPNLGCIYADVTGRFPKPPPKYTVANPIMQTDPGEVAANEKKIVLDTVSRMTDAAVNILENWIGTVSKESVMAPSVDSFLTKSAGKHQFRPDFHRGGYPVSTESLIAQIQYEFVAYYFAKQQYRMSKKHLNSVLSFLKSFPDVLHELTWDMGIIEGYCRALNVGIFSKTPTTSSVSAVVLKEGLSEKTIGILENDKHSVSLTTRNIVGSSPWRGFFAASSIIVHIKESLAVRSGAIKFLAKRDNARLFCQCLLAVVNRVDSSSKAVIISMYLKLLCSCEPRLEQFLTKSGVKMALGSYGDLVKTSAISTDHSTVVTEIPHPCCSKRYSNTGDPLWCLTRSFDPGELKTTIFPALQPFRLPARYKVPGTLVHLYVRLPMGYVQDIIGLFSSKMKQTAATGNQETAQHLVNGCMRELEIASVPNDPLVHGVISSEPLKLELENWHELLHRNADVRQVGLITQKLVPKVKGYVGALASVRSGAGSASSSVSAGGSSIEMATLTAAFLLNSCDWEYLVGRVMTNPEDRIMNFAKLLAAMCHELSQGNVQPLKLVARTFFDIMLPTVENTTGIQYKRKATGEKQPAVSRQLVSRQQLAGVVYLVKEQTATSLLIGFFGKLFNSIQGGMAGVFIEHADLWPVSFSECSNLNEDFIREMLATCLRNGLLINPNNAFCLRTQADFFVVSNYYRSAMEFYIQTMVASSDGFSKPLPDNVVDDTMFRNMIKCCTKLKRHTEAALLAQFLSDAKEGLSLGSKALEESHIPDAQTAYYQFIWQTTFFELFMNEMYRFFAFQLS